MAKIILKSIAINNFMDFDDCVCGTFSDKLNVVLEDKKTLGSFMFRKAFDWGMCTLTAKEDRIVSGSGCSDIFLFLGNASNKKDDFALRRSLGKNGRSSFFINEEPFPSKEAYVNHIKTIIRPSIYFADNSERDCLFSESEAKDYVKFLEKISQEKQCFVKTGHKLVAIGGDTLIGCIEYDICSRRIDITPL